MNVPCPHCGKQIELVGAKELKEEFGIGPNSVGLARESGEFPKPFLSFGNRNIYLRDDIEEYAAKRMDGKLNRLSPGVLVRRLEEILHEGDISEEERREIRRRLETL